MVQSLGRIVKGCLYSFDTEPPLVLTTQIFAPSNAASSGPGPTLKVSRFAPFRADNLVTLLLAKLTTHTLAHRKHIGRGGSGQKRSQHRTVSRPKLGYVVRPRIDTQIFSPSKASPLGLAPPVNIPRDTPSLARSLLTLLLMVFVTQMLAPSKAMWNGYCPTRKVPRTAPSLARNLVTLSGKFVTQMLAHQKPSH